jgi:hypothetical protein
MAIIFFKERTIAGHLSIIPALMKVRQEDLKLKVILGYTDRPCLKKQKQYKK